MEGEARGVGPKADLEREVVWIVYCIFVQSADKGGRGISNPENVADILYVWSLITSFLPPPQKAKNSHFMSIFCILDQEVSFRLKQYMENATLSQ